EDTFSLLIFWDYQVKEKPPSQPRVAMKYSVMRWHASSNCPAMLSETQHLWSNFRQGSGQIDVEILRCAQNDKREWLLVQNRKTFQLYKSSEVEYPLMRRLERLLR